MHAFLDLLLYYPSIWLLACIAVTSSTHHPGIQMRQIGPSEVKCQGGGLALQGTQLGDLTTFAQATNVVFSKTFYSGSVANDSIIVPKFVMQWDDRMPRSELVWAIAVKPSTYGRNASSPIVHHSLWDFVSGWHHKQNMLLNCYRS